MQATQLKAKEKQKIYSKNIKQNKWAKIRNRYKRISDQSSKRCI